MSDGRRDALLKSRSDVLEKHQLYQATYIRETFKEFGGLLESAATLLRSATAQTTRLLNDTDDALKIIDLELCGTDAEPDVPEGDADMYIDRHFGEHGKDLGPCEAHARAEAVANFIIKNLLDFEAWLDDRLFKDEDATAERVRFHTEVSDDGRSIIMHHLTEYKSADRCKTPRVDGRIRKWAVPPDDDFLEDFEAGAVRSCVIWACMELGIDIDEYLDEYPDNDGKASGANTDAPCESAVRHGSGDDNHDDAMSDAADENAAYVWSIVNDRLSALERWVESKTGKPGISASVTICGDTVTVRIARHSDMECEPLLVREIKVRNGRDTGIFINRFLSEAYNIVFGTFVNLSYSEFVDYISVATDSPHNADNEEFE